MAKNVQIHSGPLRAAYGPWAVVTGASDGIWPCDSDRIGAGGVLARSGRASSRVAREGCGPSEGAIRD